MARTPIVGGNWKMHLDLEGALGLASDVRNRLGSHRGTDVVIFPSFPFLAPIAERLRDSRVELGAQDLWTESKGAFTGAVSAAMLSSVGCRWALIGHSERRHVFGEPDALVANKLRVALAGGLRPVLCVGETLEERQASKMLEVLSRQLDSALAPHGAGSLGSLVIAYEPVWAIGTGQVASTAQAQEAHAFIRGHIKTTHGPAFAEAVRIQYGGSVKGSNAAPLLSQPDIDGALVGGASLQADEFAAIVRARAA
jgi:triosephosphate isomerase (TIM)